MKNKKVDREDKVKYILIALIGVTSITAGYVIGVNSTKKAISIGLQKCWDIDPTLKDHMWSAANKIL